MSLLSLLLGNLIQAEENSAQKLFHTTVGSEWNGPFCIVSTFTFGTLNAL